MLQGAVPIFKVRRYKIIYIKFQNFVFASFQITINSYHRGGFRVQKKVVTNFCKIDTIYIKVIALIFVVVAVIIVIANVAILFCFELLVVTAWYMPMLVASEIP